MNSNSQAEADGGHVGYQLVADLPGEQQTHHIKNFFMSTSARFKADEKRRKLEKRIEEKDLQ